MTIRKSIIAFFAGISLASAAPAAAAEQKSGIPRTLHGDWIVSSRTCDSTTPQDYNVHIDARSANDIETGECKLVSISKNPNFDTYKVTLMCGGHEPEDRPRRRIQTWSLDKFGSDDLLIVYRPEFNAIFSYRRCR